MSLFWARGPLWSHSEAFCSLSFVIRFRSLFGESRGLSDGCAQPNVIYVDPCPAAVELSPCALESTRGKEKLWGAPRDLLDSVFVLHPKQEGQAMAMLASQVPVPIMPLLEALPRLLNADMYWIFPLFHLNTPWGVVRFKKGDFQLPSQWTHIPVRAPNKWNSPLPSVEPILFPLPRVRLLWFHLNNTC